jgi:hypothetical protein
MDIAGYPNAGAGVMISLRVVMGKLCQFSLYCKPGGAQAGTLTTPTAPLSTRRISRRRPRICKRR